MSMPLAAWVLHMKCTRCGTESEVDTSFCSECGAIMNAPPLPPVEEAPVEKQAPEPVPYPPVFGPSRPAHHEKAPVRGLNLAELLFLISGILLLASGFDNLGAGIGGLPLQFLLLGIVATVFGLLQVAMVVMPSTLAGIERSTSMLTVVIALLFLIWGMAAAFGDLVGVDGGFLVAAGLSSILGLMLREGMIR